MQRELVIARYREDLEWISQLADLHIHVYDKSSNLDSLSQPHLPENLQLTQLPNVGREAHTYLTHIITQYDRMADVTVFLQGNPHDHVFNLSQQLNELPQDPGFRELGHTPIVDDATGSPAHSGLDIAGFYESLFRAKPPAFYPFHAGTNFAVSRAIIRHRPREFYQRTLHEISASEFGPWKIERLWPMIFSPLKPRSGIVTAATADVFFDLQQLLRSLEKFPCFPVEVFDLGLTNPQKVWINKHPQRHLRELPRFVNRVRRLQRAREWPTWLKPFYLLHSHFDRLLWIDADCIVLRDPSEAFELMRQHPLVMKDVSPASVRNHPSLYHELQVGNVDPEARLNAGVVGLDRYRDAELLGAWAWSVQWAARNLRLRNRFRWFDQGALLWSLQRLSLATVIRPNLTWNTPWLSEENVVEQSVLNGFSLPEQLRRMFPEAGIVHFLGNRKLSRQCQHLLTGQLGKTGNLAESTIPD